MANEALVRAIAELFDVARAVDEDRLSRIESRLEMLEAQQKAGTSSGWLSPPAAAKSRGISVKRVRSLMESGAVQKRAKAPGPNPKFEISTSSLDAALAGDVPAAPAQPINAQSWAAQWAARKAGA